MIKDLHQFILSNILESSLINTYSEQTNSADKNETKPCYRHTKGSLEFIGTNFNILKTAYNSLFESHLQYGTHLTMGPKKQ